MPGEYLRGFPDPENSPNEKFLLPSTPQLWQDDLYKDLINNGAPHDLALAISRSIAQHEDRKALIEAHAQRHLEWWANIHTHSGMSGGGPSYPDPSEIDIFLGRGNTQSGVISAQYDSTERWTYNPSDIGEVIALAVDADKNVYLGDSASPYKIRCLDGSNASVIWTFDAIEAVRSIQVDSQGRVYATTGPTEKLLYKIDPSGNEIWSEAMGSGFSQAWGVTPAGPTDEDNGVIVGLENGNIRKYDSDGVMDWENDTASSSIVRGVAVNQDGVILGCNHGGHVFEVMPDGTDGLLDEDLTSEQLRDIAVDQNGNIYVCGDGGTAWKLDFEGTVLWTESHTGSARRIDVDPWGAIYVASGQTLYKYNADDGELDWSEEYSTSSTYTIPALATFPGIANIGHGW